ncbi:MAG: HAMP domain-containing histidine kinase [Clostridiales bacterium]|nr:HAMP domain-containing histidine kinase [Clostridiales bacterium]
MVNALKKKFIIITIISVVIVFAVILGVINIINYSRVAKDADNVVSFLAMNDGRFNTPGEGELLPPGEGEGELPPDKGNRDDFDKSLEEYKLNKETPYSTRFFSVRFNPDESTTCDLKQIAAISQEEAISMANEAVSSNKDSGYIGNYRYKVVNDGSMVIFVDCTQQLDYAQNFFLISMIVAFSAIVAIFVLILLISNKVVKPIAESYEKQKQFITDASHELKTPLTIISANNEIEEMEHGESESTKAISKQVNKMTSMVKNLTALARLDEASAIEKAELDLSNIVNDAIELFRPAITSNERLFDYSVEDGIKIQGDEKLIKELISIILENASKYAKTKTNFKLSRQGQKIAILAQNDADGIKEENMDACFERFYRSADARASGKEGSGIGLSIAREIVLRHKGTITAFGDNQGMFNIKIILQ